MVVEVDDRQGARDLVEQRASRPGREQEVGVEEQLVRSPGHTPLNALKPPSTGTTTPVTNREPGLHSQSSADTRSAAARTRRGGVCPTIVRPRAVSPPSSSRKAGSPPE